MFWIQDENNVVNTLMLNCGLAILSFIELGNLFKIWLEFSFVSENAKFLMQPNTV